MNIKSFYILKKVFSLLNEKRQLKIIKYNKIHQFKLKKSLIYYKFVSCNYIIYETNITGKIYDTFTDRLLYRGGIFKCKKNGYGLEYDKNEKIKFIGEFLDGKRNGQGKDAPNGELIFYGEFSNDKRNGKRKDFLDDYLTFNGEYLNGEKWNGIEKVYENHFNIVMILKYEKEYKNGKLLNIKEYVLNKKSIKNNIIIEGKGIINEYDDKEKLKFYNEYLNGDLNGKKIRYYKIEDDLLEELYLNGKRKGKSKGIIRGKLRNEEDYLNGEIIKGNKYYDDIKIEKEYRNGKLWNVKEYDKNSNIINEIKEGSGYYKEYDKSFGKLLFEGNYLNGERNGIFREYDKFNGKLKFVGKYSNGERNGKEIYYEEDIIF